MLRGSLSDLGIADLVQIPASAGKTGELLIATLERDARLYFVHGRLVHLAMADLDGPAVLREIVSWHEGEFEFRPDVVTEEMSFDGELGPALEQAAQLARQEPEGDDDDPAVREERLRKALYEFLSETEFAIHACVVYSNGTMDVCGAPRMSTPRWLEELRRSVVAIVEGYPRRQLRRLLFEDDEGTLVLTSLCDGASLLVAAKKDAKLGAVSVAADRLNRTVRRIMKLAETP